MKKTFKRIFASLMVAVMVLTAAPLSGFAGINLPDLSEVFSTKADAAVERRLGDVNGDYIVNSSDALHVLQHSCGVYIIESDNSNYGDVNKDSKITSFDALLILRFSAGLMGESLENWEDFFVISPERPTLAYDTVLESDTLYLSLYVVSGTAYALDIECSFSDNLICRTIGIEDNTFTTIGSNNIDEVNSIMKTSLVKFNAIDRGAKFLTVEFDLVDFATEPTIDIIAYDCDRELSVIDMGKGPFTYTLNGQGQATITGYNGEIPSELVIPSTIDGFDVVGIGDCAFEDCSGLTRIEIPQGVTSIGDHAFSECRYVTDVDIPYGVKSIGAYAFDFCTSLADLELPESVVTIGDYAFAFSNLLSHVNIPKNVYAIGKAPFLGCSSLTEITVDDENIAYIDEDGILLNYNKTELIQYPIGKSAVNYEIPDTVETVGCHAFGGAINLESIKIPHRTAHIMEMTFISCTNLKEIEIGNGIRYIDDDAFYDCINLTDVYYYGTEEEWNEIEIAPYNEPLLNATIHFLGEQGFTYELDENDDAIITGYNGEVPSELEIPSAIDGYTVVAIGEKAFKNCDSFTSIAIPDSVKTMGKYAFNGCLSLVSVTIGKGLESFSDVTTPFENCYSLESITVDSENMSFSSDEYGVLFNKDKTELVRYPIGNTRPDYTIPVGVKKIRFAAFVSCKSIINVIVPEGVEIIDYAAFAFCNNLAKVELPDSIARIGEYAFVECQVLDNVTLGSNVEYIGDYAFADCQVLSNVTLGSNVEYIGDYAFHLCYELKQAIIPDSVTYIGDGAYGLCKNLTTVKIGDGVKSIGELAFAECHSLTDLIIGNSVQMIDIAAFGNCIKLTSVTIPDSVTYIGGDAFACCMALEVINMGKGVESIDEGAFRDCTSLTDVYYNGTEDEWNEIEIAAKNEPLLNANIHFLGKHNLTHFTIPSTCKVQGMEYDLCSDCGETFNVKVLPLADHTWGGWTVIREATTALEGLKQRKCSVCGTTEDELIPKLKVLIDDKSGIVIEYEDEYGEGVEIVVEETYDGNSFQLIDLNYGNNQTKIFDISTVKDGEKVQPDGKVKVRIPLPEGFGTKNIFVCYVDSTNGTVKNIPAKVVDGFVEFEAEHFSYYAVVEKLGKVNSVSINDVSVNYKDSVTITPTINVDKDVKYTVSYSSSNDSVATVDANGRVTTRDTGDATITVTVTDEYGNTVTDTCNVNVTYKWWQWIIVIVLFGWIWY